MLSVQRTHDHVVQFYSTVGFLASVVAPFLAPNLRDGGQVLLVCTFEHLSAILATLRKFGIDTARLRRSDRLRWEDARLILATSLNSNGLNEETMHLKIGKLVRALCARPADRPLHVFGELVELLWVDGRRAEALSLEAYWNTLSRELNFQLLCAYNIDSSTVNASAHRAICAAHSHVLAPETPMRLRHIEDGHRHAPRLGEREMILALHRRDQSIGDRLRRELPQELLALITHTHLIQFQDPSALSREIGRLSKRIEGALQTSLLLADEIAQTALENVSLSEALQTFAAVTDRLSNVTCQARVSRHFVDPARAERELLYGIAREVIHRALRAGDVTKIRITLSRRLTAQHLAVHHDGENLILLGADDDRLRRLLYQAHALGYRPRIRPGKSSAPQLDCRWRCAP